MLVLVVHPDFVLGALLLLCPFHLLGLAQLVNHVGQSQLEHALAEDLVKQVEVDEFELVFGLVEFVFDDFNCHNPVISDILVHQEVEDYFDWDLFKGRCCFVQAAIFQFAVVFLDIGLDTSPPPPLDNFLLLSKG